ncbi:NAD(P)-dependent oxidoreductase [Patescibacteria group bacterium]|nr:NAD(P)-dependent oxidoreductase [Patescibacteria group bacterium]
MAKSKFPKTLVTGADGMVGSYLDFGLKTDRKDLDVTDLAAVRAFVAREKPEVILHLAALTDLEFMEGHPETAYQVNTVGAYNIALSAKEIGARLVFVSTAGVFDGMKKSSYNERDLPNPQNVYGHSKYAAELIIQSMLKNYLIVRTCWMFGGGPKRDKKFVAKIIAQLDKPEISAVNNSFGSPTFGKDLAGALKKLIAAGKRGIIHCAGAGRASRFDVAEEIVSVLKPGLPVKPVSEKTFKLKARRVPNEALASRPGLMRSWRKALREYLEAEWKPVAR